MAPAIKRKREDAEDPVSLKALKNPRHSTSVSKEQTIVPDSKHQNAPHSQTSNVNSKDIPKDNFHASTGSSFPDVELNGQHHDSKSQNGDVKNSEIHSNGFEIIGTEEKTSKQYRKRKKRGVNKEIEANTPNEDELKGSKNQIISNEPGTILQRSLSFPPTSSPWRFSTANAGRFINHKPVFVDNDKSIILSVSSALRIYSVSTSALVHSISLSSLAYEPASIIAYTVSAVDEQIVYISAKNNLLFKVDWKTGQRLGQWQGPSDLMFLSTFSHDGYGPPEDILIYVEQGKAGSRIIARSMSKGAEHSKVLKKVIYTSKDVIKHLECDPSGIIVAHTEDCLLVGSPAFNKVNFMEIQYAWREAQVAEKISCVDIRTHERDITSKKSDSQQPSSTLIVDVIVGDGKGAVIIYYDFLAVVSQHNGINQYSRVDGRQIHWHRSVISTARWSADGNYIISGGNERTLVIWQLDTSRPQFLPHLPSSIESVVVSYNGTLYALRLGDNSIIVVKTSDLEPKASITGIQADSWAVSEGHVKQPRHDYPASDWSTLKSHLFLRLPSIISPVHSSHLLLAVPSIQTPSETQKGCPYLQSFDHSSGRSISRQALSRTNATVKQIGGDLSPISEPTVYLIKSTHDGNWLATVDEWTPTASSSEHYSDDAVNLPNSIRREIYLKFWKKDQKTQEWVLVARVDAPHTTWDSDYEPGLVLDIAANPRRAEFATIGEDGIVKIWKPKIRTRDGLVIRAAKTDEEGLWSWSCRRIIPLNQPIDIEEDSQNPSSACLTYSEDASTLAASCQYGGSRDPCLVHFIQTLNGEIKLSRTGLVKGSPLAMGFINRHLIILSEDIIVWDVVDDCLQYGFNLPPSESSDMYRSASTHLAIDPINNTFAVALPVPRAFTNVKKSKHPPAQIAVFSPEQPSPQFRIESPYPITALHFNPSNRGYLAIDAAAEIRHITPTAATIPEVSDAVVVVPDDEKEPGSVTRNVYAKLELPELSFADNSNLQRKLVDEPDANKDDETDNDDPPIVRKEQLAEIFDVGSTFSMPPVDKLFAQVARLYIGQPKA